MNGEVIEYLTAAAEWDAVLEAQEVVTQEVAWDLAAERRGE